MSDEHPRAPSSSTWISALQASINALQQQLHEVQHVATRSYDRGEDLRRDVERLESRVDEAAAQHSALAVKTNETIHLAQRVAADLQVLANSVRVGHITQPIHVGTGTQPTAHEDESRARTELWKRLAVAVTALAVTLGALATWLAAR